MAVKRYDTMDQWENHCGNKYKCRNTNDIPVQAVIDINVEECHKIVKATIHGSKKQLFHSN